MDSCGCIICSSDLQEITNNMVLEGLPLSKVITSLSTDYGLEVSLQELKSHLMVFQIAYKEEPRTYQTPEGRELEPIGNNLETIDFSQYSFDQTNLESIAAYTQKLNLNLYLNQMKIALKQQQDVIDGKAEFVPLDTLRAAEIAYKLLDSSTAMSLLINQQRAVKTVESLGYEVKQPQLPYVPATQPNNPIDTPAQDNAVDDVSEEK